MKTTNRKPAQQQAPVAPDCKPLILSAALNADKYLPPDFPAVYARVKAVVPTLTLGGFHDALRELADSKQIRLQPFTRALATIEDRHNAMFRDGEVMYYISRP